jgi:hypothetical protein
VIVVPLRRNQVEGKQEATIGVRMHCLYRQQEDGTFNLVLMTPDRSSLRKLIKHMPQGANYIVAVAVGTWRTEGEFEVGGCHGFNASTLRRQVIKAGQVSGDQGNR